MFSQVDANKSQCIDRDEMKQFVNNLLQGHSKNKTDFTPKTYENLEEKEIEEHEKRERKKAMQEFL